MTGHHSVPFVNLPAQYGPLRTALIDAFDEVCSTGSYILGPTVKQFESEIASSLGVKHALGVGSGTDAILLTLKALGIGPGHEVITVPNTFIGTVGAICASGARPKFVDVRSDYNMDPGLLSDSITDRTRAIIPVHLTGNPCDMDAICAIAAEHRIAVVEDAAQAIGAAYHDAAVGSIGAAGCFSLHPLKNLHLMGDAGIITTNDSNLSERIKLLRNHGLESRDHAVCWGHNSKLDALQAAFGLVKLPFLAQWNQRYRDIATRYTDRLESLVDVPQIAPNVVPVFHNYIIRVEQRAGLIEWLTQRQIETKVHYPIPVHLMAAADQIGYSRGDFPVAEGQSHQILSLPIYPELTNDQIDYVCEAIGSFFHADAGSGRVRTE